MSKNGNGAFMSALAGSIAGGMLVKRVWLDKYHALRTELEASERERELLYAWLLMKRRERDLASFFDECGLRTVAVLGMNRMGRMAIDELGERAAYGVEAEDYNAVHERLTVYRLGEDDLPEADAMLVCDLACTEEKRVAAQKAFNGTVVTLAEALS